MDDEGKVWQIKIREGVTWENGDPLNANDVYYTWQMILDPKLANLRARNFAKDVIEIDHAMDYFQGNCTWDEVGLKLIDDYTLEIHTLPSSSILIGSSAASSPLKVQKVLSSFGK